MNNDFWNDYNDKYKKYFQEWFVDRGVEMSIGDLYGAYYWQNIQEKIDDSTPEKYIKSSNRDKFLLYVSRLLEVGSLKVKTFEYQEEIQKREKNSTMYLLVNSREWGKSEIEEGINYIKKEWDSFDSKENRKHFEDFGVMFTLPKNEWMM